MMRQRHAAGADRLAHDRAQKRGIQLSSKYRNIRFLTVAALKHAALKHAALQALRNRVRKQVVSCANFCN